MAAELASAEEDLVAAAAQHFSSNCGASVLGFQFPPDSSLLWVKYSLDGDNMRAQARTQAFAFHQLAREGIGRDKRVRVPEIYQVFESEIAEAGHPHRYVFIVMEYIPGISVRDALYEHGEHHSRLYKVADALAALVDLPPPPDARPGPVGGGLIRNFTFAKEYEEHESDAPREFLDLKDLEDYVNKANVVVNSGLVADFMSEGLSLCYCDPNLQNFLILPGSAYADDIYVIDFEHTSWLPRCFLSFELQKQALFDLDERVWDASRHLAPSHNNVVAVWALNLARSKGREIERLPCRGIEHRDSRERETAPRANSEEER